MHILLAKNDVDFKIFVCRTVTLVIRVFPRFVLCFRYINVAVVLLLICYTAPTDLHFNWTLIDHVSKHEVIEPYVAVDNACHKKHTRC